MARTNRKLQEDQRWQRKGGAHRVKIPVPEVCPDCNGVGIISNHYLSDVVYTNHDCPTCEGVGEIDEEEYL